MSVFTHVINCVCKYGHIPPLFAAHVSVYTHGRSCRVLNRTRLALVCRARVRLCTRNARACANTDFKALESTFTCSEKHTHDRGVCKVGHDLSLPFTNVSVYAHRSFSRVHKRTCWWPIRTRMLHIEVSLRYVRAMPTHQHPSVLTCALCRTKNARGGGPTFGSFYVLCAFRE